MEEKNSTPNSEASRETSQVRRFGGRDRLGGTKQKLFEDKRQ